MTYFIEYTNETELFVNIIKIMKKESSFHNKIIQFIKSNLSDKSLIVGGGGNIYLYIFILILFYSSSVMAMKLRPYYIQYSTERLSINDFQQILDSQNINNDQDPILNKRLFIISENIQTGFSFVRNINFKTIKIGIDFIIKNSDNPNILKKIESFTTPFGKKIKQINSAFSVIDESKSIHDRVTYGLKFFGMDKLFFEKGIQISLQIGKPIGVAGFLTKLISFGKLPELNLAFAIVPLLFEIFLTESLSLYPGLTTDMEQHSKYTQLISLGGIKRTTRKIRSKKQNKIKKQNKNNKKTNRKQFI